MTGSRIVSSSRKWWLAPLVSLGALSAQQPAWSLAAEPTAPALRVSNYVRIAGDDVRGRVVLFGGDVLRATWEWNGAIWTRMRPATLPSQRVNFALAFDRQRARTVLVGGQGATILDETWEWDGVNWIERLPVHRLQPRMNHAMVYDDARQRIFAFGGDGTFYPLSDNWEWDGTDWVEHPSLHAPTPRRSHAMAYDRIRARTVMFGGLDLNNQFNSETWEWDGTDWRIVTPLHAPSPRMAASMTYDSVRQEVVVVDGVDNFANFAQETWTFNGVDWTNVAPAVPVFGVGNGQMAFDDARGQSVVVRGPETWTRTGQGWQQRTELFAPRESALLAYDSNRDRTVLFDSRFQVTWEWDGTRWLNREPAVEPALIVDAQVAHDPFHRSTVLFGGDTLQATHTWLFDGSNWTDAQPAHSPSLRSGHAMAYDSVGNRVLLFGGRDSPFFARSDCWTWDGADWAQVSSQHAPNPRGSHRMTTDTVRGRIVLFGGTAPPSTVFTDTWEWNGVDWIGTNPAHNPPATGLMAYHRATQRTVMLLNGGTWLWDGVDWTPGPSANGILGTSLASDEQHGTLVLQGAIIGETYTYGTAGAAVAVAVGRGCGSPSLRAEPTAGSRPVLGTTQTIDIANVPAGIAFVSYGWSNAQAGPFALPFSLTALGAPGCELLQSDDLVAQPTVSTGPATARHSLFIPNAPIFVGAHLWLQPWAPAPGQNTAGLIMANAVSLLIGGV